VLLGVGATADEGGARACPNLPVGASTSHCAVSSELVSISRLSRAALMVGGTRCFYARTSIHISGLIESSTGIWTT
jgi:hypothetical protein